MNRFLRMLLVGLAALFGGLVIWSITGHFAWQFGEIGAGVWVVGCFLIAGYAMHRALPEPDNSDLLLAEQILVDFDEHEISCSQ